MLDISSYMPQPFTMHVADGLDITSPVPNVATGKLIAGFNEYRAEQFRRAEAGEALHVDTIPGWPETNEELATLMFGAEETKRLMDTGYPQVFIVQAATCAVIYWANGGSEDAVHDYLEAASGNTETAAAPKGNRAQRRSKSGRHSE